MMEKRKEDYFFMVDAYNCNKNLKWCTFSNMEKNIGVDRDTCSRYCSGRSKSMNPVIVEALSCFILSGGWYHSIVKIRKPNKGSFRKKTDTGLVTSDLTKNDIAESIVQATIAQIEERGRIKKLEEDKRNNQVSIVRGVVTVLVIVAAGFVLLAM